MEFFRIDDDVLFRQNPVDPPSLIALGGLGEFHGERAAGHAALWIVHANVVLELSEVRLITQVIRVNVHKLAGRRTLESRLSSASRRPRRRLGPEQILPD